MLEVVVSPSRLDGRGGSLHYPFEKPLVAAGALAALGAILLGSCSPKGKKPVDLVSDEAALLEGSVAGRDRPWIAGQTGKPVRIDDEVRRTVPASPPSRLQRPRSCLLL